MYMRMPERWPGFIYSYLHELARRPALAPIGRDARPPGANEIPSRAHAHPSKCAWTDVTALTGISGRPPFLCGRCIRRPEMAGECEAHQGPAARKNALWSPSQGSGRRVCPHDRVKVPPASL